jgi:adenylate cyclase
MGYPWRPAPEYAPAGPDAVERQLAAILSADAVGYSRLMAEDEAATVRTLGAYRREIGELVVEHRGRVVDAPGDNVLAAFATALDAVACAVEIQRVLGARNAGLGEARRMPFRIGVHLGDVTLEDGRIYGEGVNVAARLEGLAEPGGICLSRTVCEQVRHKLDLRYRDLGEQSLKNIPEPVRAYRVAIEAVGAGPSRGASRTRSRILAAAGGALLIAIAGVLVERSGSLGSRAPEATPPEPPRGEAPLGAADFAGAPAIAVLPFDNLSRDPEQEYFADGIAEDLITRLSGWGSFPVIARNSSFTYKGRAVDVIQVGRELGVRYVVEGSVRRAEDRVRISAQLIDATSGHHVWAETYDRELRDVFALQDEISEAVVAAMGPQLQRSERERAIRRDPRDLAAWDLLMKGFWYEQQFNARDNATARSLFEQASARDPRLASALWGLALTHYADLSNGWTDAPDRSRAAVEDLASRCVALDARDPNCQFALALADAVTGRRDEMLAALELALELNPSNALAYGFLGNMRAVSGRPAAAIASLEQAMRLSPHDPATWFYAAGMGWAHFAAGRYGEAVRWLQTSLQWRNDYNLAYRGLAASYARLGRLEEARAALAEALRLEPELTTAKIRSELRVADPSFMEPYVDGLRRAGLPD